MWCAKCQSEVAVEARPNSQRLQCATCGSEIVAKMSGRPTPPANQPPHQPPAESGHAPPPHHPPAGKNPHDLLARWAGNQLFDPFGPLVPPEPPKGPPAPSRNEPARADNPPPKPPANQPPTHKPTGGIDQSARLRVDPAFTQGWSDVPPPHVPATPQRSNSRPPKLVDQEMPPGYRAHQPGRLRGPHFDTSRVRHRPRRINWIAVFGQSLAYVGAATLTAGAGLVLVGYLGGPVHYAPTGWFTTTVGQMLLFLGVVTLVSAGMEQTTVEVAERIDTLGEQLNRFEYQFQSSGGGGGGDQEVEAQLRAEIAHLRQQLGENNRD